MDYFVTATVVDSTPDGWEGMRQIPAFILDSRVQGVRDCADAEAIARRLLSAPNRVVHACAVERLTESERLTA